MQITTLIAWMNLEGERTKFSLLFLLALFPCLLLLLLLFLLWILANFPFSSFWLGCDNTQSAYLQNLFDFSTFNLTVDTFIVYSQSALNRYCCCCCILVFVMVVKVLFRFTVLFWQFIIISYRDIQTEQIATLFRLTSFVALICYWIIY